MCTPRLFCFLRIIDSEENIRTGWRKRICVDLEISLEATLRLLNPGQHKQPVTASRRSLGYSQKLFCVLFFLNFLSFYWFLFVELLLLEIGLRFVLLAIGSRFVLLAIGLSFLNPWR